MIVTYRIIHNRKNKLNKRGEALIQIEAYQNGKRRYFSTMLYVKPSEFSDNPRNNRYLRDIDRNNIILNLSSELRNFEMKYRAVNGDFSLKDFDLFGIRIEANKPQTFTYFFESEVENQKSYVSDLVWKQQKKNFKNFQQFASRNVRFDEVNFELVQGFDIYLKNQGLGGNTVKKRHAQLRKYINLAIKKKFIRLEENPYLSFKPVGENVDWVFLEAHEVKSIEELKFTKEDALTEKARDMYLFGVYTGMRFSDIYALNMSNLALKEQEIFLKFKAQKTSKTIKLPLHLLFDGKPAKVIRKYFRSDSKRLFFGLTNPNCNLELKVIAELAKINKRLHFHSSRHTFGSIAVQILPVKVVQEIMQHADLRMTVKYTHLSDETRDNILRDTDWKSI
jgi:integrase